MDDLTKTAFLNRPDLHVGTEGEFKGWRTWSRDNFETHNGPFWHRMEDDGRIRCAFRVEKKHLNDASNVHGGAFMSFADYCLFATAAPLLQGPAVTVSFACEFLDGAREGELIEGLGEITRAGVSMIFLRGILKSGERPLFSFSGTIKRVKRRLPVAAGSDARRRRLQPRTGVGDRMNKETGIDIERITAATDDVRLLIGELDRTLAAEYLPEQRHGLALEALFQQHIRFFLARLNGAAVGCGGMALFDDFAEVKRMYVREIVRGRGVAPALLTQIETEARAAGFAILRLETGERQAAALRFYARAGFRPCAAFGDYATMRPEEISTSIFMEKRLAPPTP